MNTFILRVVFLLSLPVALLPFLSTVHAAPNNNDSPLHSSLMDQESRMEKEKTEYVQGSILDRILGQGKAIAIVDIELGMETRVVKQAAKENKLEKKKRMNEMEYLLPGVPNPKSVSGESAPGESKEETGQAEETKVEVRTVLRKQSVTILHDEKVEAEKLDTVREAVVASLKLDLKRDRVDFKKTKFTPTFWDELMHPKALIPVIIAVLLLLFLFGPLASFFRSLVQTMRDKGGAEVMVDSKFENGPEAEKEAADKDAAELAALEAEAAAAEGQEEKFVPFVYVNDENLRQLIYLIRKEQPSMIALVLSYLKPEYVREILSALTPEVQAQVAVEMAQVRLTTQEDLMAFDTGLKEKIDYVIGGLDHLLQVLEKVDRMTLENILEYLKNEKPDLYDKVRKFIVTFEDIPSFPDQALQIIIRELKSESLARALRGAAPEIMNKFFANMSSTAAAILKEEMEYGRPATAEEIEEEKRKILDTVKRLEKDGKVFIREKPKNAILEGETEVTAEEQAEAGFRQYFDAGVQSYDAAQYEDAIAYFEYCTELDPASAQVFQYLGNAYYAVGSSAKALVAYEKSLELDPGNEDLRSFLATSVRGTI